MSSTSVLVRMPGFGQGAKTEESGVRNPRVAPTSPEASPNGKKEPGKRSERPFGQFLLMFWKVRLFPNDGTENRIRPLLHHSSIHRPQVDDLKADGCEEVFFEKVSSTTTRIRGINSVPASVLRKGDLLCVAKLDRLGRSQVEVINRLNDLQQQGIHVRTLDGLIDTQALGKMAPLVVGLLTGLSEVERSLIQERSRESVEHRRKTGGDLGGRPKTSAKKEALVLRLREEGESYRSIKEQTGLALATITRIVKEQEVA